MKLLSRYISLALGITLLSITACKNSKDNNNTASTTSSTDALQQMKVAYVNMDSVYANLDYFQEVKAELKKMENNMTAELQSIQRSIINTQNTVQNKIKNKDISEEEMASFEKKLSNLNQSLQRKNESLTAQIMEKQSVMALEIDELTTAFFKEYNKEKGYELILANNQVKTVFYADEKLDITQEVITAFNEYVTKIKRNMVVNQTLGNLQKDNSSDTNTTTNDK